MATFASRLRTALDINNITAAELSKRTGISKGSISQYLKGSFVPKSDKVYLISQALNVTPTWLMAFDDPDIRLLSEEVRVLFNSLPSDRQEQALAYLHFLAQLDTDTKETTAPDSDK